MSVNPFDDDNGSFLVLINDEEQNSLWPDIRPKSLRDRSAHGQGSMATTIAAEESS
ncbi:MbtH family NRPS accessory protein [Mycolicibacterium porcinum]|uniref:MbtH family NRPS accessory protein n=1 Tax=Mycolicibacterium porcinum TaxID=39693 RepID=UPI0009F7313D|nr:MbtH family NRPS accessory protein [Mycolicibacterium porcinum]